MLVWIENTSLALWVGTSLWAYPVLLSAHITGLAVIVGIIAMRDFPLLGFINGVTEANFLELKKLAYCGFLINGISGIMLFASQASYLSTNLPFLVKLFFRLFSEFLKSLRLIHPLSGLRPYLFQLLRYQFQQDKELLTGVQLLRL